MTGMNTLAVMPAPPVDAPPVVAAAWALRAEANVTGMCPACRATVTVPNRHERRAAQVTGRMVRASMVHEPACPAGDEGVMRIQQAAVT